jgi:hypothetical protein
MTQSVAEFVQSRSTISLDLERPMTLHSPRRTRDLFVLFLPLLITACSQHGGLGDPRPASAAVLVDNRSWSDIVVYLAEGNAPFRLGRVAALERTWLPVPNPIAALGVRLVVRSVEASSPIYVGQPMLPGAGGVLELTVQPLLEQSTLSVLSYGPLER